ncbi:GGDEF domain-containing protein [Anabaena sp. UHCC 0187]|uniref:GGDEF domain-containing protein n=1 Tax=Anabaena sp. UHCC 0187 TaxID=2590018 RepID=UPI00352ABAEC
MVGRWGGEEFVVGMYGTGIKDGIGRLTQLLQQFSQYSFTSLDGTRFQVTFSGGIAQIPDHGQDIQTLYQKADIALYEAKSQGRNRICAATLGEKLYGR